MVTTRTGHKLDRVVRFNGGGVLKRVLDFGSPSAWDLTAENRDSEAFTDAEGPKNTSCASLANARAGNGHVQSAAAFCPSDESTQTNNDVTIEYDVNANPCSAVTVIWDTIAFAAISAIFCTMAAFTNAYFGSPVYLVSVAGTFVLFHYTITYFDSAQPGIVPPSPISPSKFRRASGHTFHLTYVMSLLTGVVFLLAHLWLLPSRPVPVV